MSELISGGVTLRPQDGTAIGAFWRSWRTVEGAMWRP
jgi:hypothetical protein